VEGEEGSATVWEGLPPYPINSGCAAAESSKLGEEIHFLSHIPLILRDPLGSIDVGKHQDVEQLGAVSGAERVWATAEGVLDLVECHAGTHARPSDGSITNCHKTSCGRWRHRCRGWRLHAIHPRRRPVLIPLAIPLDGKEYE
jgi:hypothetical protein